MLRVVHTFSPLNRCFLRRSLASSVLLTRSWHNETLVELRREARARGLSSKGTKAAIIQRLQEYAKQQAPDPITPNPPVPSRTRSASTIASAAPASAAQGATPVPPQSSTSASMSVPPGPTVWNIQLPEAFQPEPETPVQIPYVPDFWDSRTPSVSEPEVLLPKLVVVAGADTHHGGGPSHSFVDAHDLEATSEPAPTKVEPGGTSGTTSAANGGLFYDIAEDLGFLSIVSTTPKSPRKPFWQLFS